MQSIRGPDENIGGAIAQLGERLLCTQEVGGSIPPGSTTLYVAVTDKVSIPGIGRGSSLFNNSDFFLTFKRVSARFPSSADKLNSVAFAHVANDTAERFLRFGRNADEP